LHRTYKNRCNETIVKKSQNQKLYSRTKLKKRSQKPNSKSKKKAQETKLKKLKDQIKNVQKPKSNTYVKKRSHIYNIKKCGEPKDQS
jgi:hypothetical protein